jgi:DNA repair exonuclease SbcCD ATPase subunit
MVVGYKKEGAENKEEKFAVLEDKSNQSNKYVVWHIEGGLGKNVAATALISSVKNRYSDRKLILVVSYPEVFLNHPDIHRVYRIGMTSYFYDDYIKDKDTIVFRHEPYFQSDHIMRKKHLIENWCDILGIPYYVFNNTILLSINDFKSFIKMSVQDKRAIVDKIFGFHILNQMRDALKEESKKIKESMDNLSGQMTSIKNSIEKSHSEMESLASEIEEKSKERLGSLNESLEAFIKLQEIHSQKITDFKKIETEFNSSNLSANQSLTEARTKMKDILRRLSLYESDKCPTCESPLDTDFHSDVKNGLEVESKKMESNLSEIESLILDLRKKEADINSTKSDLRDKGNKISAKIIEVNREIESLSHKSGRDEQLGALKRIIDNLESDSQSIQSESFKVEEKSNWIKTLDDILSEKGVKQLAIRTILPSLNSEILDLLGQMHLDYQVVFDEEFKATIYHMGIEIPVQTLSTGEMKKVDFVVLVAIMKLMKLKFSSINLLFLDELFSSVDPDGIYSILKILQRITRELGLNIFVINHAPMPHEIFDWKLEVKKMNNFSAIAIDKF